MSFELKSKIYDGIMMAIIFILSISLIIGIFNYEKVSAYAASDYYVITIGDTDIVALSSVEKAEEVVDLIGKSYLTEGSLVKSISYEPEVTINLRNRKEEKIHMPLTNVENALKYILLGTKEPKEYTVKNGDTIWGIATKLKFSIDELERMNEDLNPELIHSGDKLKLYEIKPFVKVITDEVITSEKAVKHKVEYRKSSELLKGMKKVVKTGEDGKKEITASVVKVNGVIHEKKILEQEIIDKSKKTIIETGTKTISSVGSGKTYEGSGSEIANYALNFVGKPYSYGGTNLETGTDCSGFVQAVYDKFGITLCHDADAMRNYGVSVSIGEAQLGDIVCYNAHVGIYIGGGRIVHAYNETYGVTTSSAHVMGILDVRRIVE